MLPAEVKAISENITLHVIDLETITEKISAQITDNLVEICEGDSGTDINITKRNFSKFLSTKDERTRHGAVAEFFIHMYLRQRGLKQEFLFLNLEEGSIKKGFDGYFSHDSEEYLVESKSGSAKTINISHKRKLLEAYNDISGVISGNSNKSKNNPWRNAYNHAAHADVGTSKTIRKKIKEVSDLYDTGTFQDVSSFNIIPCSTIILENYIASSYSTDILQMKNDFFDIFKAKTTTLVCITKSTFVAFIKYLGDEI